ncbi:MAG TPA: hypothetical protein VGV68_13490 [Terriglobia bacterium]|nr:hypothetical protein [Terriglobia bacterium]
MNDFNWGGVFRVSLTVYHATLGDSRIKIAQTFNPDFFPGQGEKTSNPEKKEQLSQ